jgi:hypothetical protein
MELGSFVLDVGILIFALLATQLTVELVFSEGLHVELILILIKNVSHSQP